MTAREHSLIFRGSLMPRLLDGSKTRTMRLMAKHNSLIDGSGPGNMWPELRLSEAWVDKGPSPIGNPGPYLQVPRSADGDNYVHRVYPRIQPGDVIWSRETWGAADLSYASGNSDPPRTIAYRADKTARVFGSYGAFDEVEPGGVDADGHPWREVPAIDRESWNWDCIVWRSPLHQFRWAARFVSPPLVRVFPQRPSQLTAAECIAEGIDAADPDPRMAFARLWRDIHGAESCAADPWCWVYEWSKS